MKILMKPSLNSKFVIVKKLLEVFMKKNCKKTSQEKFRIEKVLKRKGDKLYVK